MLYLYHSNFVQKSFPIHQFLKLKKKILKHYVHHNFWYSLTFYKIMSHASGGFVMD